MKKARAAEEQLLEPLTRELFKNLREGIVVVDAQGFITQMNPFAATILNLSPRRIIGQHFRDVFCSTLPLTQCWVQRALRDDLPIRNHQFNMLQANGEPLRLHADFTPIQGTDGSTRGAVITLHELDERDLLLERVAEVRMKQEAILDSIADAVFTVDQEWRITSFNRAAERITGFREQEVLGNYCSKVLNSNACTDNCPLAATLKNNHTIYDYDLKIRRRDREEISVRVNTAILRDANSVPRGGVISMRKLLTGCGAGTSESTFHGIIGQSKAMRELFQLITEIADSTETVLITGESGTGKTILADAIHRASRRRDRPFVKINCSVFPETLLESELFGHVRGAFTGAENNRRGRFLLADRGTIFIDEIGDTPPSVQVKLLRVLEDKSFEPIGSSDTIRVDTRIVTATNQNLEELVRRKVFREDLYYRINVIPIYLPPLRERREDIPLLVDFFMEKYRQLTGKQVFEIDERAHQRLLEYDYPGNVRELENAIAYAFARTHGGIIQENRLPASICDCRDTGAVPGEGGSRRELEQVLEQCQWNRERAAQLLGISRTTLWRRMKKFGLLSPTEQS